MRTADIGGNGDMDKTLDRNFRAEWPVRGWLLSSRSSEVCCRHVLPTSLPMWQVTDMFKLRENSSGFLESLSQKVYLREEKRVY